MEQLYADLTRSRLATVGELLTMTFEELTLRAETLRQLVEDTGRSDLAEELRIARSIESSFHLQAKAQKLAQAAQALCTIAQVTINVHPERRGDLMGSVSCLADLDHIQALERAVSHVRAVIAEYKGETE